MKEDNGSSLDTEYEIKDTDFYSDDCNTILPRIKKLWAFGEWDKITSVSFEDVENDPERAKLILLVSSAYQHKNDYVNSKKFIRLAMRWGCNNQDVAKVCMADAYNAIARISALQTDDKKAEFYFHKSVDIGFLKDAELIAHSRAVREMASLGLIPQAKKMVSNKLSDLNDNNNKVKDINSTISILSTELELLSHELSLAQQRMQLYGPVDRKKELDEEWGESDSFIENLKKRSVSQLGQDLWVLSKSDYKRNGYFVEFGATDGILLSNTYLLEKEFGWKGICAEPNPKFFDKLKENRNCKVVNSCISGESGEIVEFVFADEFGGMVKYAFEDNHSDKRLSYECIAGKVLLETISLNDFLLQNEAPKNIDYLSIDTEGSEYEILSNFSFDEWNVRLISVEHNYTNKREDIYELLSSYGYNRCELSFDDLYFK
jgi:FkbM family methyltransferase